MLTLPPAISGYFAGAQNNARKGFEACFTPDAIVHDEGKTYHGIEAIKAWHIAATDPNSVTTRAISMRQENGKIVVPAEVSGTFKGSPIVLDFVFTLKGDLIAELEIH
ncbi:MAG TPA: nuclear transport factor 2 family protein [Devosiaceae bacterium]|jgi:hypothetical protein